MSEGKNPDEDRWVLFAYFYIYINLPIAVQFG